jgi:hypothetical protein
MNSGNLLLFYFTVYFLLLCCWVFGWLFDLMLVANVDLMGFLELRI